MCIRAVVPIKVILISFPFAIITIFAVFTIIQVYSLLNVLPLYLEVVLLLLDFIFRILTYKSLDAIVTRLVKKLVYKDFDFLKLFF